jgi:hypothetical protein
MSNNNCNIDNKSLNDNGFFLLKNALSENDNIILRSNLDTSFKLEYKTLSDSEKARFDIFNLYPNLRIALFNQTLINFLKKNLGDDFLLLNEMSALKSSYVDWHKDTTTLEMLGNKHHYRKDFQVFNVLLYLQENKIFEKGGGGLDVIPGTHLADCDPYITPLSNGNKKDFLYYLKRVLPNLISIYSNFLKKFFGIRIDFKKKKKLSIPNKIGDYVIINLKLEHKATWPQKKTDEDIKNKYLISFLVGKNNEASKLIMESIKKRKDYLYLTNQKFKSDFLEDLSKYNINFYY